MIRTVAAFTILAGVLAAAVPAQAQGRVRAGVLDCDIAPGMGFIIGSRKEVACQFTPSARGWRREVYYGSIDKFGIDIGATSGGRMVWAVYAPTSRHAWALAGNYGGASAEATVGAGLGANVLVGGSNRTVSLQPLSVQGQAGLNVAAGVSELRLRPAR